MWEKEELHKFLNQLSISNKRSFRRLRYLSRSSEPEIAQLAKLVLDIVKAKPHKKKRLKFLARNRRDLIDRMVEIGLLEPRVPEDYEPTEPYDDEPDETDNWPDTLNWNGNWIGHCEEYDFVGFDAFDADERSSLYLEPERVSDDEECLHSETDPRMPEAGDSYFIYQFEDPPENHQQENQVIEDVFDDDYYYSW
jgi:hypothetical protein